MRRKKQQNRLQPISEVLSAVLKKKSMISKIEENALMKLWPKAVGPQIASKTRPDCLRGGTLFIKTVSSVWVQQLHFMKEEIRNKLNELAKRNAIKEIRFAVGYTPILATAKNISSTRRSALKERDKKMIADCTGALSDRELASIFERVMQLEISRRRQLENEKVR